MKGSMRERKPGVWELRVYGGLDPISGKERTVSRTFRGGKREASTALAKLVSELDDPTRRRQAAPSKITLARLITERLEAWDGSATTKSSYQSLFRTHIEPTVGRLPIGELDTRLLDRYYRWLKDDKGLSDSTVKSVHALIRGSLRQATIWGYIGVNPAVEARPRSPQRHDVHLPDAERVRVALHRLKEIDDEFACFVRLAAATGARRGELCGLRWSDVDIEAGELRIEAGLITTTESGVVRQDTKTHTRRRVAVDDDTVATLREHLGVMQTRAAIAGVTVAADGYVFSHAVDGSKPWRPDNVSTKWNRMRPRLGLDGVRLHDLRHLQATTLLRAGVPVKNVSKRLGHRNAATTLNVYAQFLEEADRESADVMGQVLARPENNSSSSS